MVANLELAELVDHEGPSVLDSLENQLRRPLVDSGLVGEHHEVLARR